MATFRIAFLAAVAAALCLPIGAAISWYSSPWSEPIGPASETGTFIVEVRTDESALPDPRRMTFAVRPIDPDSRAGLQFDAFSPLVAAELERRGMARSPRPDFTVWVNCVTFDGREDPRLHKDVFTLVIANNAVAPGRPHRIVYRASAHCLMPDMDDELPVVMPRMIRAFFQDFPARTGARQLVPCRWQ